MIYLNFKKLILNYLLNIVCACTCQSANRGQRTPLGYCSSPSPLMKKGPSCFYHAATILQVRWPSSFWGILCLPSLLPLPSVFDWDYRLVTFHLSLGVFFVLLMWVPESNSGHQTCKASTSGHWTILLGLMIFACVLFSFMFIFYFKWTFVIFTFR